MCSALQEHSASSRQSVLLHPAARLERNGHLDPSSSETRRETTIPQVCAIADSQARVPLRVPRRSDDIQHPNQGCDWSGNWGGYLPGDLRVDLWGDLLGHRPLHRSPRLERPGNRAPKSAVRQWRHRAVGERGIPADGHGPPQDFYAEAVRQVPRTEEPSVGACCGRLQPLYLHDKAHGARLSRSGSGGEVTLV